MTVAANANVHQNAGNPGVEVDRPGLHIFGTGELLTSQGRGVKNGRPYGQQLEAEARELHMRWRLQPGVASKLRAATRSALGR